MRDITTVEEAEAMRTLFLRTNHTAAAFDTEADGLHIIHARPFLFQFGWYDEEQQQGWTFTVDLELNNKLALRVIDIWQHLVKRVYIYVGHNVKFDMHMVANIGLPYTESNLSDTIVYIRLGSDAVSTKNGGAPLGLKPFCAMYIDRKAKGYDNLIQVERRNIAGAYNTRLKNRLNRCPAPPKEWGFKSWTKGCIDKFFSDKIRVVNDLPSPEAIEAYNTWLELDLPLYLRAQLEGGAVTTDMIRYNDVDRALVTRYGHWDIVYTLETLRKIMPIVKARGNMDTLDRENRNIVPIYEMERVGFKVDKEYLMNSKESMREYIIERRKDFKRLAGQDISIGQKTVVRDVLNDFYGIQTATTNSDDLDIIVAKLKRTGDNLQAVDFIETLQELRTLEKWYSTYICRFVNQLKKHDRIYTTVNQSGTVSGRVTSDFQQFPKGGITTLDGIELFQPRKMVIVSGDGYNGIVYLDYSQIELRFQAFYTILVGHPDLNLCRAYMPYQCTSTEYGEFDYRNREHLKHSYDIEWHYNEKQDTVWTPTDVHGATTKAAFDIDETHPDYHSLRYVGKTVNFAKNYGAQRGQIETMFPNYSDEQITKIDNAYYVAFPGVKEYHSYCYCVVNTTAGVANMLGRKYYGTNGHVLINYLVQGSAADFLKEKIYEVSKLLKNGGYKTRLQMQIHDELSFEWHQDDSPTLFFELQALMQEWTDTQVPIVADMELTITTWADKYEVKDVKDFG